ncbi:MAG: cbb3-type cytochrome c oxidase N-terminal domain-containing protein [Melioribacteraceae bacterium]
MKSLNRGLITILLIMVTLLNSTQISAATEAGYNLDKIMRVMLVLTLVVIAVVIWLTVVYSEKNDHNGDMFKRPLAKFKNYLTRLTPIEKEQELLLNHEFDGIRELDNKIPPWFHFLFYGTIAWGIIYMLAFHVFDDGQIQTNEYNAEIQQASLERQILIKTGAFLNEETVVELKDAAALSEGKEIFSKNCISCHAADGGGIVGPNLTDDFWINGGGIKNIFKTVKYGVPAKGMISWQTQLDPRKMQAVSSYIISLHGTKPANPKAPEGNKYVEPAKIDSSKTI